MNTFPLVDLFPISTTRPSEKESARCSAMGASAWAPAVWPTPLDLALCFAGNRVNGAASNAAERALKVNSSYKTCTSFMPILKTVTAISTYRKGHKSDWNQKAIDCEIRKHGRLLPASQVLYHGGIWDKGAPCCTGSKSTNPDVLSTSWLPQVAAAHAATHGQHGSLWVITVEHGASLLAVCFKGRLTERLHDEFEVLIQSGTVLTCTSWRSTAGFPVIECSIAAANVGE